MDQMLATVVICGCILRNFSDLWLDRVICALILTENVV